MRTLLALCILSLAIGCSGPTQTYDVAVKNDLNQPITLWLTKNGPPAEPKWLSPEELATYENPRGERISGVAVPAGKTATTGKISGHFPAGTEAVLRVYLGQHTLDELLATGSRSASRLDVTLSPGRSDLVVRDNQGKLAIEPSPRRL